MSPLRTLALLALIGVGGSAPTSGCSYVGLLTHLNLTTANSLLTAMRPVRDWTKATLVQMDMLLYGILQVDEKFQTVTTHTWIQMRWKNEFLSWNPSDFCGIDSVCIPRTSVWIPDVSIREDASDSGAVHHSPVLSLSPGGWLQGRTRQRLTSTCLLNLQLFPFDTQRCNITFSSMASNGKTITLGSFLNENLLTNISEKYMVTQGEWELEKLEITHYEGTNIEPAILVFTITMCRKPLLYVVIFIVPLLYFVLLDVASFFINEARGEKLSFKVTVLLSISVLLLILKDMLPSTEKDLPMIAKYCVGVFAVVGLSVLEAMLVSFLIDLDGYCSYAKANAAAAPEDVQLEVDAHSEPDGAEGKSSPPPSRPDDLLTLILEEVKTARQEVRRRDQEEHRPRRFRRLAEAIDTVFFVLYFLCTGAFLTYLVIMWV